MKNLALAVVACVSVLAIAPAASAQGWGNRGGYGYGRGNYAGGGQVYVSPPAYNRGYNAPYVVPANEYRGYDNRAYYNDNRGWEGRRWEGRGRRW